MSKRALSTEIKSIIPAPVKIWAAFVSKRPDSPSDIDLVPCDVLAVVTTSPGDDEVVPMTWDDDVGYMDEREFPDFYRFIRGEDKLSDAVVKDAQEFWDAHHSS